MFLKLPAITFRDDDEDELFVPHKFGVLLNPIHIIAIEPDSKNTCFVIMTGEVSYKITMSMTKTESAIEEFSRENILTKIYKDIKKDAEGNN